MSENSAPEQPEATGEQADEQPSEQVEEVPTTTRQDRRDEHVRSRLKETETERDLLRDRLDARDRRHVERLAEKTLGKYGAGLFKSDQLDLADVRDEDGDVDEEQVAEMLAPVLAALEEGRQTHHGDMGPRRTNAPNKPGPSWGEFISKRR